MELAKRLEKVPHSFPFFLFHSTPFPDHPPQIATRQYKLEKDNILHQKMSSRSEVDSGSSGADLLRSASKTAEDGDPQIRSILTQLLSAAKQPPRTRIRLKIEDIYYLLTLAKQVFQSKSALVEIEVCLCCLFCFFFFLSAFHFVCCCLVFSFLPSCFSY